MAATIAELQARLSANTDDYDRALKRSEGRFHKFGSVIRTGALAAGAAIGTGLAISAKVGFDEFNEGQKVAAQTAAVLKSTGGAANVTAKHIDDLATSMMMKTGIDDEAIKSGENLLLTFTSIRNEVGKGNDIFDQATKTVQDMSVALGQDTKSSAIQLGKALNDPVRGITALRRVGVQFTDAQQEQITALVESGHQMKAQKLILAELHKEFGGSAEAAGKTFAGQMHILKETFRNTAGEIVGNFMPLIVSLAKTVLPLVAQGLEFVASWIGKFGAAAQKHGDQVRSIFHRIWSFIDENVVPILRDLRDIAVRTFQRFKRVIEDNRPALERIADRLGKLFHLVWVVLKPVLVLVFEEILPRVLTIAIKVIDKVSGAIEKVIGWVKDARDVSVRAWGRISGVVETALGWFNKVKHGIQWILDHSHIKISFDLPNAGPSFLDIVRSGIQHVGSDGVVGAVGTGPRSISSTLWDDLALANADGLIMTSGYRPGSITSTGNTSLHSIFPSKAIDMAGPEGAMRNFFLQEVARGASTGLREIIHSPYWWHPGSGIQRIPASAGSVLRDHYSHVHVGSYDRGGYLRPGWNLAYNGLGRPEPVGVGNTYNIGPVYGTVDDSFYRMIREADARHNRRNG